MIVFLRRLSRTATLPRVTVVRVPSQRSVTVKIVPRTVAEEKRPRVRKRPFAFARRRRIFRRETRRREAAARLPRRLRQVEAAALEYQVGESSGRAPAGLQYLENPAEEVALLDAVAAVARARNPRATLAAVDLRPDRDLARLGQWGEAPALRLARRALEEPPFGRTRTLPDRRSSTVRVPRRGASTV